MTVSSAASQPSRSAQRRARRKRSAASSAADSSAVQAPQSAQQPASGKAAKRQPDRRPQHRRPLDPYATPDTGGVIARSDLPRPLTLCFELADGERLRAVLAADPTTADLAIVVANKLAWTNAYNAALPADRDPAPISKSRPKRR